MRKFFARGLITAAWSMYGAALFVPAVSSRWPTETGHIVDVNSGAACLLVVLLLWPFYWPLAGANLLMFVGPLFWAKAYGEVRRYFGLLLLVPFAFAMIGARDWELVHLGYYLWSASFLAAAVAFLASSKVWPSEIEPPLQAS